MNEYLPEISESTWQSQVFGLLRMFGWRWWHDDATNNRRRCRCGGEWVCSRDRRHPYTQIRNRRGLQDLIIWRGPFMILAELKRQSGKLTDDQRDIAESMADVRYTRSTVWRPGHSQAVADILRDPAAAFRRAFEATGRAWPG